jgi:outer membrane immunogenic protein
VKALARFAVLSGSVALTFFAMAGPEPLPVNESKNEAKPEEPRLWQGFYIGVNGGYAFDLDTDVSDRDFLNAGPPVKTFSFDSDGPVAGGQVGFNLQPLNWLVLGIEGDGGYFGVHGRARQPGSSPNGTFATIDPGAYVTVRGRIGLARDRWLLYVTGGWFGSNYERSINDTTICSCGTVLGKGSNDDFESGYTVGGGLEWLFRDHWSLRIEYLYFNLENSTVNVPIFQSGTFRFGFDDDGHIVRGGLNFKF